MVVTYMQHSRAASRSQSAPHVHILVCICSNVRQFIMLIIMTHIGVPPDVCRQPFDLFCQHLSVCRSTAYVLLPLYQSSQLVFGITLAAKVAYCWQLPLVPYPLELSSCTFDMRVLGTRLWTIHIKAGARRAKRELTEHLVKE